MSVIKEWNCAAHGDFDGPEPVCPHGCSEGMVVRTFRTPPAIRSASFDNINRTFEALASDHGLTDMSNSAGEGMRRFGWKERQRMSQDMAALGVDQEAWRRPRFVDIADKAQVSSIPRPMHEVIAPVFDTRSNNGPLHKDAGGPIMSGAIPLPTPRPVHDGGKPFDGRDLGVPEGT